MPQALPRFPAGASSATDALIVLSWTPNAAPQNRTPVTAGTVSLLNPSQGTAAAKTQRLRAGTTVVRNFTLPQ